MNIALVLTHKFEPNEGGVQRTTSKLAKIFEAQRHNVIIVSYVNDTTSVKDYEGIKLFQVNEKESSALKKIFQEEQIDCIINQMGFSLELTKLLLKVKPRDTKIINTLRINPLNFYDNHKNTLKDFFERKKIGFLNTYITRKIILAYHIFRQNVELGFIVKNTDAFVMLSEKFKPELLFLVPKLKKYLHKIHGIGNPFQRPELDIKTLPKENIVVYVGSLNIRQKRVDLLLEIWEKLHAQSPDWKFWVLGEGPEKKNMEEFCKKNNLDRIHFFGNVNPNDYYKKAKIFHMTSAFEGFGNVLIEAQSYGCVPMLFDSYSAASDIVYHNENGILVQPFDCNEYAAETKKLMDNPEKTSELAFNAYENVLRFSYEETYKKWEKVFETIK